MWIALLLPAAHAATLEVALKDRTGTLHVPSDMDVAVSFEGGATATPVSASWTNADGNSFAVTCADKGTPPDDDVVSQVVLQVGEEKWALAPGSNVHFTCPTGKKVTVTDLRSTAVGAFPDQVVMTITKAKSRAEH